MCGTKQGATPPKCADLSKGDTRDKLAEDIKANGQKVPIELYGGKILDGRRRWLACQIAGIEPDTINVDSAIDDPVAHVLSLNLHRRHLTVSQASMCAARAKELAAKLAEEAKERQKARKGNQPGATVPNCAPLETGKTRDKLAAQFGVSHGPAEESAFHGFHLWPIVTRCDCRAVQSPKRFWGHPGRF